ncbi:hypothetical protein [Sphingomonas sp.]|uniref:hypothetical protein n=1 Tax=Sphingomonas sp. TaxID=28214 RepID=UPI001EB62B21|nr:hypothetical protein [Sphingomonas sp.]MBX3595748.1 hypothetical protein [Sphingomonas sp.]
MRRTLALAPFILIAGCATTPAPAPRPPAPVPVPTYTPPPVAPAPSPYAGDWRDWPVTPGTWTYRADPRGSLAAFGVTGAVPVFTIRCDRALRQVQLQRVGVASGAMTIRTSSTLRGLVAQPGAGAVLAAGDTLLDAMGFSRGRFIVETPPLAPLVVPAWAEVSRVVEDCRG